MDHVHGGTVIRPLGRRELEEEGKSPEPESGESGCRRSRKGRVKNYWEVLDMWGHRMPIWVRRQSSADLSLMDSCPDPIDLATNHRNLLGL
ncbi:hypothetical protein HNY73_022300 [Argiope bruennichi]|uniref:Uncharacterized protein n=1 Tax=Argiope bruennichi TaxID=94029 RepID=A0A8T0E2T0_ARGBR|nr:hypothetical protein HNY73_022300 [Argiope bruennichi]